MASGYEDTMCMSCEYLRFACMCPVYEAYGPAEPDYYVPYREGVEQALQKIADAEYAQSVDMFWARTWTLPSKVATRYSAAAIRHDYYGTITPASAEHFEVNVLKPRDPIGSVFYFDYRYDGSTKKNEIDLTRYPHVCPHCNGPAYIGLSDIDCAKGCA